ncbi:MAG TPA: class II aldolase/adducin family protein [Bacillota bacterium]
MVQQELVELQQISTAVGIPIDYTQGGGGNTSVKLGNQLMAVKASGFKLKQITPGEGYVLVNYQKILDFYHQIDPDRMNDLEKESGQLLKDSVVIKDTMKPLRPSVEAGFHSLLKKYVIHTHPVYANILCCAQNGRELAQRIFGGKSYGWVWIPYVNPGFSLTLKIKAAIEEALERKGEFPQVIFMENHGLIVNADDCTNCIILHQAVNDLIRDYLGIKGPYPQIELVAGDDQTIISKTPYIMDYFKGSKLSDDFFDEVVLYPDQLVYLNGEISTGRMDRKVNIHLQSGTVTYKTGLAEAQTIEETLLAYLYVIKGIRSHGLQIKTMTSQEIGFIKNWESEAYRKRLTKEATAK